MRHQMSDKEKAYWFVLLFPPLWPLGIAMVLVDLAVVISDFLTWLWRKVTR